MKIPEFKIRCSAIGKIMTNPREKGRLLSATAESYCDLWLKEQIFNRKKSFSSKHTEKGQIVEDNSIDFIAEQLGYGFLIKNEDSFKNEFMTGTPDILPPNGNIVIDVKNSWDWSTFPLFEDKIPNSDYYWQLQGYMALTGRKNAQLIYVLSDTPYNLIEREAYYHCRNNGYDMDDDILKGFQEDMTYGNIEAKYKLKV